MRAAPSLGRGRAWGPVSAECPPPHRDSPSPAHSDAHRYPGPYRQEGSPTRIEDPLHTGTLPHSRPLPPLAHPHTRSTHLWTGTVQTRRDLHTQGTPHSLTPTSMGAPRPMHTQTQVHTGLYRHMRPAPAVLRCTPVSTHTARSVCTDSACKQGHPHRTLQHTGTYVSTQSSSEAGGPASL